MTLLHTRTGATGFSHPEFGDYDVADDGTVEVPEPLANELLNTRVAGVAQWESDIDHRSRLLAEERDRRKDPATLLAEVERLTGNIPAPASAPVSPTAFDPSSLSNEALEQLLSERRAEAGLPPLVPEQQQEPAPEESSETVNDDPEDESTHILGEPTEEEVTEENAAVVTGADGVEHTGELPANPVDETAQLIADSAKRIPLVAQALTVDDYDELHATELTALSELRGLNGAGPKADLIQRLRDKDAGQASQQ